VWIAGVPDSDGFGLGGVILLRIANNPGGFCTEVGLFYGSVLIGGNDWFFFPCDSRRRNSFHGFFLSLGFRRRLRESARSTEQQNCAKTYDNPLDALQTYSTKCPNFHSTLLEILQFQVERAHVCERKPQR